MITRGFFGRKVSPEIAARLPPGQYKEDGFPVLSAGPNPRIDMATWKFSLKVGPKKIKSWSWAELNALPKAKLHTDIHCVTKWSKFDTNWEGVTVDALLADAGITAPPTPYVLAHSDDDYTTNVPYKDLSGEQGAVVVSYEGYPIPPDHGGPARLFVPHLYFWKSAKWVNAIQFTERDEPGFWELRGYHIYGDPWREQRFTGDP